jgi:hypothetical protein
MPQSYADLRKSLQALNGSSNTSVSLRVKKRFAENIRWETLFRE